MIYELSDGFFCVYSHKKKKKKAGHKVTDDMEGTMVDTTGDGVANAVGYDTTGDGLIDVSPAVERVQLDLLTPTPAPQGGPPAACCSKVFLTGCWLRCRLLM